MFLTYSMIDLDINIYVHKTFRVPSKTTENNSMLQQKAMANNDDNNNNQKVREFKRESKICIHCHCKHEFKIVVVGGSCIHIQIFIEMSSRCMELEKILRNSDHVETNKLFK